MNKELLKKVKKERNWSTNTYYSYNEALKIYCKIHKINFKKLLEEAQIENNSPWNETKLKKRLIIYRKYLFDNYNISSAKAYLLRIISLYKHFEIKIYDLPYISEKRVKKTPPLLFKDLPDQKIIKKAISISPPLMKALILFMVSSGCAKAETLSLTIEDFIIATENYHDIDLINKVDDELIIQQTINELINQDDIIPTFQINRQKTNKFYFTFSSPESTKAILNYLLTRKDKLTLQSRLFKINDRYFTEIFVNINETLQLGKVGGKNRFRSHMLRKYHASRLAMSTKDPKTGQRISGMNMNDINALQGRTKEGSSKSYFFDDFEGIKELYAQSLHKLTIFEDIDVYKSKEYLDLEKKLRIQKNNYESEIEEKEERYDELESKIKTQDEKIDKLLELLN